MHDDVLRFANVLAETHSATLIVVVFEVSGMERFAEQADIFDYIGADPCASPLW